MIFATRQDRWLFLAVIVTCGCLLAAPGHAKAQAQEDTRPALADSASTVAFVLALSGRPQGVLPVSVADIKTVVSDQLTATLTSQGHTVIPQWKVLSLMREWRVRDGKSIPRGFLDSLADSLGAGVLMVANLVVEHDRLVLTARYSNPRSAVLLEVNMAEWVVDPYYNEASAVAGETWLAGAREASRLVAGTRFLTPHPAREPMLILDTQPVGCSASVALMANHALLDYFVEHGDWAFIDPAVTSATLHDAGYDAKYLGAEARALLRTTFACPDLMIPGFISYAPARRPRGQLVQYDEIPRQAETVISDFAMSLRLIDLASGSITAGREVFLAVPDKFGWFGNPRNETLMTRLRVAAGQLGTDIHKAGGSLK